MKIEQIESVSTTNADVIDFAISRRILVPSPRIPIARQFEAPSVITGPAWYLRFDAENGLTTRFISNSKTSLHAEFYLNKDVARGWQNSVVGVAWQPLGNATTQESNPELFFSPVRRNDDGEFEALSLKLGSVPDEVDFFVPLKAWPLSMLRGKRIADALYQSVIQKVKYGGYDFTFWEAFLNDKGATLPAEAALAINTGLLHSPNGKTLEVKSTLPVLASQQPIGAEFIGAAS